MGDEVKYRDVSHKLRNTLRLLRSYKPPLEKETLPRINQLIDTAKQLLGGKALADKYQLDQLITKVQQSSESREVSISMSKISEDQPPPSARMSVSESHDKQDSSMVVDDSNKEPSEVSQNQSKIKIQPFKEFCRKHEANFLEMLSINKNLISDMEGGEWMYVVGTSQPKEMRKLIMCGYMKFEAGEVVNLQENTKDFDSFINSQRYPIGLSRSLAENEELDGAFLHSIANIDNQVKLGLIRRGNRLLMFKLTNAGQDLLKKCNLKGQHSHGWQQKSSEYVSFYDETQLAKCIGEEKEMHTKIIRRSNEVNNVKKVVNGVQVSEKIEPKSDNYKFPEKFYFNIQKYNKWPYLVLIPNDQNVLTSVHKLNKLEDMVKIYAQQRVVVCCKSPKNIPAAFSKALLEMKNAIACAISIKFKGNFFLLYKLSAQTTEDKIQDILWDDLDGGKIPGIYEKISTYCATNAKEFEVKQVAVTEINSEG